MVSLRLCRSESASPLHWVRALVVLTPATAIASCEYPEYFLFHGYYGQARIYSESLGLQLVLLDHRFALNLYYHVPIPWNWLYASLTGIQVYVQPSRENKPT